MYLSNKRYYVLFLRSRTYHSSDEVNMIHTFTSNRLTQRKRGQFSILTMMDDLLEEEQREEPKLEKELIFTRGPMEPEERQTML